MNDTAVQRIIGSRYLFHILVWVVYGTYIFLGLQGYIVKKGWGFAMAPFFNFLALVAFLVYVNALVLIPKLLERKKVAFYVISVLLLVVVNTHLKSVCQQYWDKLVWPNDVMPVPDYYKWNFFDSFWSLLISTLLVYSQKWNEQRKRVRNIEIAQLETELKYLRSQVNPHFLFNGLNTIYGNIDIDNQKARNVLVQFSDLLRYNLYEADVDQVELGREADYLENYVALQKARSNPNLNIDLDINIQNRSVKIAPLIFVVFVENAFKFITREDNTDNYVKISLRQSANRIQFECVNSFEETGSIEGGIGLTNVRRRLELLYKDRYTLTITKEERNYSVKLILSV